MSNNPFNLPKYTFLNSPIGSGKTTLANLLRDCDPDLAIVSFAEPIRQALIAVHYPDQPNLNLRDGDIKKLLIPGTTTTNREWMINFGTWMKLLHGPDIFGILAKRTCTSVERFFSRFVFDDNRFEDELLPFTYIPSDCLLLDIARPSVDWSGDVGGPIHNKQILRKIIHNNSTPEELLSSLAKELTHANTSA